jgi:glutathione synthase/RimK-type ligase-like ATP-grasp enzyme
MIYPQVMFVTNKDDFACDYLIYRFLDKQVPYLRLNSEDITEVSISYQPDKIEVLFEDLNYNLCNVKSVYFRRAPTVFPPALNEIDTQFINRERRDFLEGLYCSLDAKWINPIFSTYRSERKLLQLHTAKKIGLYTPKTIVSNDPVKIIEFVNRCDGCIIKPISHGLQVTNEGVYSIYTSEVSSVDLLETDKLFESPVLIQERINNHRDIRVTIVGKHVFAVEIEKNNPDEVDWRAPDIVKGYQKHELPEHIIHQLYSLHKVLNISYSAIDFILTPEGKYIFLETNPAGEWVWLEKELDLKISDSIINELLSD